MRKLNSHKVNGCNENLEIDVCDEPGSGGANHEYEIVNMAAKPTDDNPHTDESLCVLKFQNGPIAEVGTNGITHEALLAVLIDRLQSFQSGPYKCRENAIALTSLEEAQMWLQKRTRDRLARGVEGTHTV